MSWKGDEMSDGCETALREEIMRHEACIEDLRTQLTAADALADAVVCGGTDAEILRMIAARDAYRAARGSK